MVNKSWTDGTKNILFDRKSNMSSKMWRRRKNTGFTANRVRRGRKKLPHSPEIEWIEEKNNYLIHSKIKVEIEIRSGAQMDVARCVVAEFNIAGREIQVKRPQNVRFEIFQGIPGRFILVVLEMSLVRGDGLGMRIRWIANDRRFDGIGAQEFFQNILQVLLGGFGAFARHVHHDWNVEKKGYIYDSRFNRY